ncbi:hypothetical protein EDC01DRAFT_725289 [Geopyxis carbonaria]|nr:hypothetical protein EDC01DRAFT_725289 [Geopyxis carbonaria]
MSSDQQLLRNKMENSQTVIFEAHSECVESFSQLISTLELNQAKNPQFKSSLDDALEEIDKYNLWAGNVGAIHSEARYTLSLDYRLREASFFRNQILKLLQSLNRTLLRTISFINESLRPASEQPDKPKNIEIQSDIDDTSDSQEDSPWEISSSEDEDDNLLAGGGKQTGFQVDRNLLLVQEPNLPQLLSSIAFAITCLYKTPIRRPAPVDRIKTMPTAESSYQDYDILYVKDKFPKLDTEVATRLGKLISRRRQLIEYRKNHGKGLEINETEGKENPEIESSGLARTEITKATTLHLDTLQYSPSVSEASSSSFVSSHPEENRPVDVPSRPKGPDGQPLIQFECPYCSIVKIIKNDRAWKKHVLQDLQPYVCTFKDCELHEHLFEDLDQWNRHERQYHRVEWFCNTENHRPFTDESDFVKHMGDAHAILCTNSNQQKTLLKMFQQSSEPSKEETCNFCEESTTNLKRHVARHLEQISLFALPRSNDSEADEGEKDLDAEIDPEVDSKAKLTELSGESTKDSEDPGHPAYRSLNESFQEQIAPSTTSRPHFSASTPGTSRQYNISSHTIFSGKVFKYGDKTEDPGNSAAQDKAGAEEHLSKGETDSVVDSKAKLTGISEESTK